MFHFQIKHISSQFSEVMGTDDILSYVIGMSMSYQIYLTILFEC